MGTPERTTASALHRYTVGEVVADSAPLHWRGLIVRHFRFPRVVERFLVPVTPEPQIVCQLAGAAEFLERDLGGEWIRRQLRRGDIFVTHSKVPYEVRFTSPAGQALETLSIHVAVDEWRAALEEVHPDSVQGGGSVSVVEFFGRDRSLAHHCFACAEMLRARVPGDSQRVTALAWLIAAHLVEQYTDVSAEKANHRGGLPARQLHKIENHVRTRLADDITVDGLAELVELSPFHFSRVFKEATGLSPLQFVTRERIARAQQLIHETPRSLIEIGFEVGYVNPSHFAKVFRRVTGVTPTQFRSVL